AAELDVKLLEAGGQPDLDAAPPVLRANVGTIVGLTQVSPGVYKAKYQLPKTRYPEVAIIVALSAWPHPQSYKGVFEVLRVPLAAYIELPGKVERNAEMTVEIGGEKFATTVGPDGQSPVPVAVP